MINWTSLKKNKYFKFLIFITIIAIIFGIIYYFKIKDIIDLKEINLENICRNNFFYHISSFFLIFFFSFLLFGFILGIYVYSFEITSFIILLFTLILKFNIKGFIIAIIIFIFRFPYFLLLVFISYSCFKISRSLISKQKYQKEKLLLHIKQSIIFSLTGIIIETFNYFIGYKFVMFLTKIL